MRVAMKRITTALFGLLLLTAPALAASSFYTQSIIKGSQPTFSARAVNLASTGDQATVAIPVNITKYAITAVWVTNCSATPGLAQLGVWTGASASGTNIVAAATLTGATSTTVIINSTLAGSVATTVLTAPTIYMNVAVANATALTCDVYVTIRDLT